MNCTSLKKKKENTFEKVMKKPSFEYDPRVYRFTEPPLAWALLAARLVCNSLWNKKINKIELNVQKKSNKCEWMIYLWWGSAGACRAPILRSQLAYLALGLLGPLGSVLQLVLHLAEFGEIERGNLLGLLELPLVGLDFVLQFLDEVLQTHLTLLLLLGLEGEVLEAAVVLLHLLERVLVVALLHLELSLKLTNALLKLLYETFAAFQRIRLRLVEPTLKLLHLDFQVFARFFSIVRMFLLIHRIEVIK